MKYMGSKNRIAKHIIPIITENRKDDQYVVCPFVGGCNFLDKLTGNRIGNDIHEYLIAMYKAIQKGWVPPSVFTEELYNDVKLNKKKYPKELVGYVGFSLAYGARWFGSWRRDSLGKRNYVDESYRSMIKQIPKIKDIIFYNKEYYDFNIPNNSIIYCDPPYEGVRGYGPILNYKLFWEWCREQKRKGHNIFISEYQAPNDFKCVWQKEIITGFGGTTKRKKNIEKLFTLN
jgi:DNA adenine methylase